MDITTTTVVAAQHIDARRMAFSLLDGPRGARGSFAGQVDDEAAARLAAQQRGKCTGELGE
jgi:hypothetical protein